MNNQIGGGNCSLCGSPGTNRSTCPLNPLAKNPNPTKHPRAMTIMKDSPEAPEAPYIDPNIPDLPSDILFHIIKMIPLSETHAIKNYISALPSDMRQRAKNIIKNRFMKWQSRYYPDIEEELPRELGPIIDNIVTKMKGELLSQYTVRWLDMRRKPKPLEEIVEIINGYTPELYRLALKYLLLLGGNPYNSWLRDILLEYGQPHINQYNDIDQAESITDQQAQSMYSIYKDHPWYSVLDDSIDPVDSSVEINTKYTDLITRLFPNWDN